MAGCCYLVLAVLLGKEIWDLLSGLQKKNRWEENPLWLMLPVSFGTGILLLTWVVYFASWAASSLVKDRNPLFYGNLVGMGLTVLLLVVVFILRKKKIRGEGGLITDTRLFAGESVFFAALFVFLVWILFYVFYIKDGLMYSGATVFGDYAPHVSMMRSFSYEANYPTQYPHFGGEDVKYHFMFQFLVGNLEYLGIRLDIAYNLVSAFALEGFFMLLYKLSARIMGSHLAAGLTAGFVVFRSGFTFFHYLYEHHLAGDLQETLASNTAFIGYTPNENWGLWCFNVYLNQRHLAFGMLLAAAAVWFFLDWVEEAADRQEKGIFWIRDRLFTRDAWRWKNPALALILGVILGLGAFWNGAAVIGGLLILFGFAAFSDGKLDYALTALVTVVLSVVQSRIFTDGGAVKFSIYWGFLAEDKSLIGILWFLFQISGFFFLGLAVLSVFLNRKQKVVLTAFLIPTLFAFCFSLTPDINVNHKYIMISYAFLSMFWGWAVVKVFKKGIMGKALAAVLTVCLTLTGVYDFVIILRNNGPGHRVTVPMESPVTQWIVDNTDSDDLMLTPEYSMCDVTVSGVMMYLGWPYYGWSAGYDTYYRADMAVKMYTTPDPQELQKTVEQEGITYILFEEGMEFEQRECREDVIAACYPLVFRSEDGRIRIYETS